MFFHSKIYVLYVNLPVVGNFIPKKSSKKVVIWRHPKKNSFLLTSALARHYSRTGTAFQNSAQSTAFALDVPPPIIASSQSACFSGASKWSVRETDFRVLRPYTQHRKRLLQYPPSVVSPTSRCSTPLAFHLQDKTGIIIIIIRMS
jgi:hypothetical protein